MTATLNAIGSVTLVMILLTISGMVSGLKRARGVSCCLVFYVYVAAIAAIAMLIVAITLLASSGMLQVRCPDLAVSVFRPRPCVRVV